MNGEDLRRRRKALGWSQDRLARELGMTRQAVYHWERGLRTSPGLLLDLAMRWLEHQAADTQERGDGDG